MKKLLVVAALAIGLASPAMAHMGGPGWGGGWHGGWGHGGWHHGFHGGYHGWGYGGYYGPSYGYPVCYDPYGAVVPCPVNGD